MSRSEGAGDPLTICVEARLVPGAWGGVEQVVVGLASGLSSLTDGAETYRFVVTDDCEWLRPYVSGPASMHIVPRPGVRIPGSEGYGDRPAWRDALAARLPGLADAWGRLKRRYILPVVDGVKGAVRTPPGPAEPEDTEPTQLPEPAPVIRVSDGTIESLGADIVHFPHQAAYLTDVPSIFHPHDLQHLHLPEFFTPEEIARREREYRAFCEQAAMVPVTSRWGRNDLLDKYGLPEDRVVVIPLAPALVTYDEPTPEERAEATERLHLPAAYLFYPAQTWPHKNHLRLIEAVAALRRDGVDVNLVCSGHMNEHFPTIAARIDSLGVADLVTFVGFVDELSLRVLYENARGLVFPTLFEAAGGFGPLFEAFAAGVPAACSTATSLAEQAGDAALLFDPYDVEDMASAMSSLWQDPNRRAELAARGSDRAAEYTWERTARTFRAHYRRIAGRELSAEDQMLIDAQTKF